jgi:hypothetical protein
MRLRRRYYFPFKAVAARRADVAAGGKNSREHSNYEKNHNPRRGFGKDTYRCHYNIEYIALFVIFQCFWGFLLSFAAP